MTYKPTDDEIVAEWSRIQDDHSLSIHEAHKKLHAWIRENALRAAGEAPAAKVPSIDADLPDAIDTRLMWIAKRFSDCSDQLQIGRELTALLDQAAAVEREDNAKIRRCAKAVVDCLYEFSDDPTCCGEHIEALDAAIRSADDG